MRAAFLLAVLVALVFAPLLFTGQTLYWGDFGVYFHPHLAYEKRELARGIVPLWNPLILCGTPFVGNPQMWPLYPSTLLLPLLPASQFLTVDCVLHVWLAAVFTYLLLRRGHLRLDFWPAVLGAVGYGCGAFLVTKWQYPNMAQALAWVPCVLWRAEALTEKQSARNAFWLGAVLGLQLLAAHAQVTVYTIYLALLLCAFRLWGQSLAQWARAAGWGILSFLLAAGSSCGEWLPVLEARRFAARQTLTLTRVDRLHLPPEQLSNFVLPYKFGLPLHGSWTGAAPLWETACFAGMVTFVLALVALLRSPLRRETAFWVGVFVLSAWLALGTRGGLFTLAYHVLPGMKLFHDPARLLLGAALALPVLAALGLQTLSHTPRTANLIGAACVLLVVLDAGAFDRQLYPLKPVAELEGQAQASPVLHSLLSDPVLNSGQGRILTVDDVNADTQFQVWTDYGQDAPRYVSRLADTCLPNLPMLAGIASAGGYEPLALAGSQYEQTAAVRDFIYYRPSLPVPVPGYYLIAMWNDAGGLNHGYVYQNEHFLPRATLQTASGLVPAHITDNAPDKVTIALPPAHDSGTLTLADTAFPGWHASMDGQPAPAAMQQNVFRNVNVPAGARTVTWTYRPTAWRLGLFVSLAALCVLTAGGVFLLVRRHQA